MGLAQLNEILLKIYSVDYLLRCKIDELNEDSIKISPVSGKVDMFQVYDPTVLIFYENNHLETFAVDVAAIDEATGQVCLNLPSRPVEDERRVFERYPASLIVSARRKFSNKRLYFIVKNISMFGMGAIAESDLDEEESLDIDLITDKNMFYFSGKVVWKNNLGKCFEYGIQLTHFDVATKQLFEGYLSNQDKEYIKMFSKAR